MCMFRWWCFQSRFITGWYYWCLVSSDSVPEYEDADVEDWIRGICTTGEAWEKEEHEEEGEEEGEGGDDTLAESDRCRLTESCLAFPRTSPGVDRAAE